MLILSSDKITIISLDVDSLSHVLGEVNISENLEWVHIDDLEDPVSPSARKKGHYAWETN